ncbi:jumonji superfamily protein [Mycena floridula]|nr:jumonji superfamily protein [Mycena floridula]
MLASSGSTPNRFSPSSRLKSPSFSTPGPSTAFPLSQDDGAKPVPTFYSCLSIPVQGAVPIDSEPAAASRPALDPAAESRRAPRKSKTEALVVINGSHSSVDPDDSEQVDLLAEKYRNKTPIPVPAAFDLASVKTPSLTEHIPPSPITRPFGLNHCPEFFPTAEEFKDPMAYVKSISDKAREYGICKVIPPEGWKMPFVTDTESFRFATRVQRLNSIEASSRAKLNFLEQLYRFHSQQGNSRVAVPTINHKPLDLWLLRKEVHKLGGYEAVSKAKKWSDLGRILGYRGVPGLSTQIKNSYSRVILPYEHFCERARNSPSGANVTRDSLLKAPTTPTPSAKQSYFNGIGFNGDSVSGPSSPLTATSSPLSEPPEDGESKELNGKSGKSRKSGRMGSSQENGVQVARTALPAGGPAVRPPKFYDDNEAKPVLEQHCEICSKKNRGEEMLLCDGCDCGFHMFCLDPPLDAIPKDQWFCFTCLAGTGGDFGFDEGEEHSLSSFQARDREFRRFWFESHPPPQTETSKHDPTMTTIGNVTVSEYDVENEFWRLVQSPHETVEIEYGADVHSMTHGSAMPTLETHPLDPYSKDPWNLNNIPIVSDSLLRYIKSDISGMTVPWTYVGMAFSTFCWHNEDHYTYSINFMHWGETKTWYGIPGDDAEKFEAAIKGEAPDLFEAQPDLLFQLVTLMNPKRLTDAGVRVNACNQRAGEFVITFPKSYHAGFNHGLNFNEAVNFALPDWLAYGRDCVQRYREHRKPPVFSHDELVITITQQSSTIKTAMWLVDSLQEMIDRELADRSKARSLGINEVLEEVDLPEEQYQCTICKTFCYLSQITCPCASQIVCVDHFELLCKRPQDHLILRKRFSDEDLRETLAKVLERAGIPAAWQSKLAKLLEESARPALRSLRAILAEGERINFQLADLSTLRKCVIRANEWVDSANSFIVRKQSRKRSRRSRGKPGSDSTDDPGERPDRSLDDLYALLQEVEILGFDCPEIASLRTLSYQAEEMKLKASALLASSDSTDREAFIGQCKRLLIDASSLNVLLDELMEIEKIVDREQLIQELDEKLEDADAPMTLDEVRQLLTRGRTCDLGADHKHMKLLEARQRVGDNWEERAKSILAQPVKTIDELDDFADMDPTIPMDPSVLDRLMSARAKAKDFEKQAKAWITPEGDAPRPRAQEVMRLVNRAEKDYSITAIADLKRVAAIATDLENRSEGILKNRYPRRDGEDVFDTIKSWKTYARDHLCMFSLPMFEKLDTQVKLHHKWVRELPWFCPDHEKPHGQAILDDVIASTRPEDDAPPTDEYFTCICNAPVRPPPPGVVSDAVQCDHCFARFHGECAKNGGSCPFCDHHHWNGEMHKDRSWHFCFLPTILQSAPDISKSYSEDWKQLEIIVHRVDRLSAVIGQFLSFTSQPVNQRVDYIHQVRHYMRKLYKIQFAVSPNPEVSYGLDLAGLHRILAGRPPAPRPKKRRRPRFTFGQDVDLDWSDGTRCICRGRTPYLLKYPTVQCDACSKLYHARCVFVSDNPGTSKPFTCPLCCLRKDKAFPYADIRVIPPGENVARDVFVDTGRMLETFSKDLLYITLDRPHKSTLFVDLIRWTPGQPEMVANGTNGSHSMNHGHHSSASRSANDSPASAPVPPPTSLIGNVPPPPWAASSRTKYGPVSPPSSGWSPGAVLTAPPPIEPMTPESSRKRRLSVEPDDVRSSSPGASFPKRRLVSAQPEASPRPALSPSLAMLMSPPLEHSSPQLYPKSPHSRAAAP